ncbi:MAG: TetM/TetW/TetO/TetS family tetracycline resistance ribosomal protection protein [Lachnospiraceae bacterium]|nr:TetM/TetW/TetO/TetS family tetracycline resistance ribosomal protection protein [Lachnospiraceae bacterium]
MKKIAIGILAHVDAGKTTLSEGLLFKSGSIRKAGRVDNKDSFLDSDKYERERGITIFSKTARLNYKDTQFIMVDTPGHIDFGAEMERTISVLDEAILIVSATDLVRAHTKTIWKLLRKAGIPTFIFVNKIDLADISKEKILENLKKELSKDVIDFSNPCNEEFYEEAATANEALLNEFLSTEAISKDNIKKAVSKCEIFPVCFGSALKMEGVDEFLDTLNEFSEAKEYPDTFGALCYKISKDKNGNRLTHLKITGGSIKVKDLIKEEKVNEIRIYSGDKYDSVNEAFAGDICVVTGLKESKAGSIYGIEGFLHETSFTPVLLYAINYPKHIDSVEMHRMLKLLEEEEPTLEVSFDELTKDIYVHLMGEVQTEILTKQIKDRYDIDVTFSTGKILYKETIEDTVEGVGHFEPLRHYAEVHLKLEPLDRGEGLIFDSSVSENDLSLNWQRLILTHLHEKTHRGVLTGSPITDMKITLVSGKAHPKHTEGGDFRQATYRAVRQGLMQTESVLLEPFYDYELTVPSDCVGRAMLDIDRMWGTSEVTSQKPEEAVITGIAPVSTLNGYAKEVRAYSKGKGSLSVSFHGYAPCHNTEEVLRDKNYIPENDVRNTPDSVFCANGSSFIVPWSEVFDYMHLPLSYKGEDTLDLDVDEPVSRNKESKDIFLSTEEVDAIINKTAYANKKKDQMSHKGISKELLNKRRVGGRSIEKPVIYKGTPKKEEYLLVDGYNVVFSWDELAEIAKSNINGAAGRLMDIVSNYSALTGIKAILVFDAYKVKDHKTEEIDYSNIKVVYTKTAETADHYIERYAHENGKKYDIHVVTSDGVEQIIIRSEGCRLISSRDFKIDYERRSKELKEANFGEGISVSHDE